LTDEEFLQGASEALAEPDQLRRQPPWSEPSPALEDALRMLPDSQREAVMMIHVEDLSVVEAALSAKVSPGALRVRAHRGYRGKRQALG
jgi:DNA-directed RNA polymerase specialized sigma24 family protein